MFNVNLYHKTNAVPRRDSLETIKKYANKIKWRANDAAIDLGCGDGSVTNNILKKFMHSDFKKLVGIDVSETMVQFANERHGDERTVFAVFDMEGDLPDQFKNCFDHVFSFFAMHWIRDQHRVFSNIKNLMREPGDCLLAFLGKTLVYDIWRALSSQTKWQPWLQKVEFYVSPYHDLKEPDKQVKHVMMETGFRNIEVNCLNKTYIYYTLEEFEYTMEAISPFKIPSELRVEFMKDFMQVVGDLGMIEKLGNEQNPVVTMKYDLIVVYGRK